jgi:SAM-dependent methyltransferase
LVEAARLPTRNPQVLEIGGGHGTLTEHLASFGADVTVSEISRHSAQVLIERFVDHPGVQVIHDADGEDVFGLPGDFDVILCISVLHHIPDYLEYVRRLVPLLRPGGTFASFQDPDWYPRRRRTDAVADKGSYYAWRLTQGNLREGARTRVRRLRGYYDESLPADMTEYHVVRQGLDDKALVERLDADFATVEMTRYWSTQASALQRLGEKLQWHNTFGVVATGHLGRKD